MKYDTVLSLAFDPDPRSLVDQNRKCLETHSRQTFDSTYLYQSFGDGLHVAYYRRLNRPTSCFRCDVYLNLNVISV
jgi:hypothetical protein